jgi:hypothetical protein
LDKAFKWLVATVLIGLIPFLLRGVIYFFLVEKTLFQPLVVTDVIIWGLVLNISIFNERYGHFNNIPIISAISSKISLLIVFFLSAIYIFASLNEINPLFDIELIKTASLLSGGFSLFVCIIYIVISNPCPYKKMDMEEVK